MADAPTSRGRGFGRSRGRGEGRGRGGGRGRGRGRRTDKDEAASWVPVTKLGRLVKDKHILRIEDIY